jgi:diguanylate cyclase (GGDEF)-like protein
VPRFTTSLLLLLAFLAWASPVRAVEIHRGCLATSVTAMPPADFDCAADIPKTAKGEWVWFRAAAPETTERQAVTIRAMTFDAVKVVVRYTDGVAHSDALMQGNYQDRWAVGGRLLIEIPTRAAPVADVTVGFFNAPMPYMLAARLIPESSARQRGSLIATLVGGSLALLLFSAFYNVALAIGSARPVLFWHAAWAACVFLWAVFTLQLALAIWPRLAGPPAHDIANVFACFAISSYGMLLIGSLEKGMIDAWLRRLTIVVAVAITGFGIANSAGPLAWQPGLHDVMRVLVLFAASTAFVVLLIAIRRGSLAARDMAFTWTLPMLAVAWAMTGNPILAHDDGGYFTVLTVSALQAIGLSVVIGRRLASAQRERETAKARQDELERLAETDSLTGVFNRRGFVARAEAALAEGEVALVLLDIDRFKAINDSHGHEVGDRALIAVAGVLASARLSGGCVGRLGGEEFGILLPGIGKPEAVAVAELLRERIAALPSPRLTASFGVAHSRTSPPGFQTLYADADRALYAAKSSGRDRVVAAEPA